MVIEWINTLNALHLDGEAIVVIGPFWIGILFYWIINKLNNKVSNKKVES